MRFSTLYELVEERNEEQRMEALQEAKRLSIVLRKHFLYERTYLFGSVLEKGRFTKHSDIDIVPITWPSSLCQGILVLEFPQNFT